MPLDAGRVKLRLSLDSSDLILETRRAARAAGNELKGLGAVYRQQTANLSSAAASQKKIIALSRDLSQQERLKLVSQQRALQLRKLDYNAARKQAQIEKTVRTQVRGSIGDRKKARIELERTLQLSTQLERTKIDLGFKNAAKDIRAANSQVGILSASVKGLGVAAKGALIGSGIGAALVAVGALTNAVKSSVGAPLAAIGAYKEYDRAISQLAVVAQKSRAELKPLTDTIRELGRETSKAPTEVANLAVSFARLGFSTEETGKALEGIIRLNEAGGGVLEETGASIASIISTFGLAATDTTMIADAFVTAANNSGASVETLGAAFDRVGGTAGAYSQSVKDVSLSLGILANNGFRDADRASTAYNQTLSQLVAKASELKDGLGVDVFDVETGNARQLTDIVGDLADKLQGLNDKDLSQVLNTIVPDKRAQKGLIALLSGLDDADEKTNSLRVALENMDGAAKTAGAKVLDSSSGQLDLLTGKAETFGNTFAASVDPAVKQVYSSLGLVFDELLNNNELFDRIGIAAEEFATTLAQNPEAVKELADLMSELIESGLNVAVNQSERLIDFLTNPEAVESMLDGMRSFVTELNSAVQGMLQMLNTAQSIGAELRGFAEPLKKFNEWTNPLSLAGKAYNAASGMFGGSGAQGAGALVGVVGNSGVGSGSHLDIRYNRAYAERSGNMAADGVTRGEVTPDVYNRILADGVPLGETPLTSGYGPRNLNIPGASKFHEGIDFGLATGTKLTSAVPIESVSEPRWTEGGGGWVTTVTFADGVAVELLHQDPSVQNAGIGTGGSSAMRGRPGGSGSWGSSSSAPVGPAPRGGSVGQAERVESDVAGAAALVETAQRLNLDPFEFAALMSWESAGTMNPNVTGGDGGAYKGLIQFSPDNQRTYGTGGQQSIAEQMPAIEQYLQDRGYDPQNPDIRAAYSAVLAGDASERYWDASDSNGTTVRNAAGKFRAGDHYERGRSFLEASLGGNVQAFTSSSGGGTGGTASANGLDPQVASFLEDARRDEKAEREAKKAADKARREALEAAKEARQSAINLRSEIDETNDMARDAVIAETRAAEDLALESARANNPNSELISAVTDRAEERLSAYRSISDEIEQNNRAARDLNQAIADERTNADIDESVNEGVIAQYEKQLQQLGRSNELLREQREQELELLNIKYKQVSEEQKLEAARARAAEVTGLQRQGASLERQLAIASEDNPLKVMELELQEALADIDANYSDQFMELRNELESLTKESEGLQAVLELDPTVEDELTQVNARLEHTSAVLTELGRNRGLEEALAGVDLEKFQEAQRTEFLGDLRTRRRDADLTILERDEGPQARRDRERELGSQDILGRSVAQMQQARDIFGAGSPQFNEAAEAIQAIADADLSDLISQTESLSETFARGIGEGSERIFKNLILQTESWGDLFNNLLNNAAEGLLQIGLDALGSSMGGGEGGFAGGIAKWISKLFGADGHIPGSSIQARNAYDGFIPNYAEGNVGGILSAAIKESERMPAGASLVMANDSEAILNQKQQKALAASVTQTSMGNVSANVSVAVNNYGEGQSSQSSGKAMGKDIEKAVIAVVNRHTKPGGKLYRGSK